MQLQTNSRVFPTTVFAGSAAEARADRSARPLPPIQRAGELQPIFQKGSSTSILVASVDAIRRTLADSVTPDAVELACAETFRQPADRERFLAGRILLRHALTKAVGGLVSPADWKYREGSYGKPMMGAGLPPLEFSVSHSGCCVAVGVSAKDPIGVDIECMDPDQGLGVVYDVLTEGERDLIQQCPADRQWAEFIRIWTAKEACSKALGLGISLDFQRMEVHFDPLRVRLLDRPLATRDFDLASTSVSRNGRRYSLSTARLLAKNE